MTTETTSVPKGLAYAYLSCATNAFTKGKGRLRPLVIEVDSDLYDAFIADVEANGKEIDKLVAAGQVFQTFPSRDKILRRDTRGWLFRIKESPAE